MQLRIVLLLGQCMCFCNLFKFSRGKTLVGPNVRRSNVGEYPYIVSLQLRKRSNVDQSKHFCTGTLVSNRDVLTAAHCLTDEPVNRVAIVIGHVDYREAQKFVPSWFLTYEKWTVRRNITPMTIHNDIGIARLAVNVSSAIQPATLCDLRNDMLVGYPAIMVGWGKMENDKKPHVLRNAVVTVISQAECIARITKLKNERQEVEPSLLCSVAEPYVLGRKGDSGGPLLYQNEVLGVAMGTCPTMDVDFHPEKINVHLGIFLFRHFVYDTMRNF